MRLFTPKTYTLTLLLCAASQLTFAQANIHSLAPNAMLNANAVFLNPSYLRNVQGLQVNFLSGNFKVANNFVSAHTILSYAKERSKDDMDFRPIHEMMGNLKKNNSILANFDLTLLNASFRVGKPKDYIHIGISLRQHFSTNITFNDQLFKLIYGGNKQFAGQSIELMPDVSAISYTDFGVAASKSFMVNEFKITPAVRLRYLLGNAAVYTKNTSLSFYTEEMGEYIEAEGVIEGYSGGVANFSEVINGGEVQTSDDFMKAMGRGFAFDLGVTAEYKNITVSIASIDNGFIRFKEHSGWIFRSTQTSIRSEGYDVTINSQDPPESQFADPIKEMDIRSKNQSFSTSIGSKLTLNANYGLLQRTDNNGYNYFKHNVGISYIQGFANKYNANSSPIIALYYQYNIFNWLSVGGNYNNFRNIHDIGANFGVRARNFDFGVATNGLFALFNQHLSKQLDLGFTFSFTFPTKKDKDLKSIIEESESFNIDNGE